MRKRKRKSQTCQSTLKLMLLRRALGFSFPRLPSIPPSKIISLFRGIQFMSPVAVEDNRDAKRARLEESKGEDGEQVKVSVPKEPSKQDVEAKAILARTPLPKSTANVPFSHGLFLAPMVRIGSLPTRLLSLRYGADLVWSPEIVDRAIMGSDRVVDSRTGMVSFLREGKQIMTTHPIERSRLIFQLGSSSPEWAYQAITHVTAHDDVAGVDLNCGCPKPFSTIGGMGAQLLSTPDLLCSVLEAMRKAAPPHISVSCKIRLLPTKEATQALVRQIIRTGTIDALTVHCRTKDMRPREKALTSRFQEVQQVVQEETGGKLPLIINGDAWDANEAAAMMKATGVKAVMIARGAEGNPSCFQSQGVESVADKIAPDWARLALTFDNNYGNTKYCISSMAFRPSSSIVPNSRPLPGPTSRKQQLQELRSKVAQSKRVEEIAAALGVNVEEEKKKPAELALLEVKQALERYDAKDQPEHINTLVKESSTVMAAIENRELGANVA
jgi:tRNA-dihydrouridine synthase 2